jgi:hypothetical protein
MGPRWPNQPVIIVWEWRRDVNRQERFQPGKVVSLSLLHQRANPSQLAKDLVSLGAVRAVEIVP